MNLTPEQKAYHLRKMRTRMLRLDVNKDGYVSREDFAQIADRIVESTDLSEQQAKATRSALLGVADDIGLTPGVRFNPEDAAKRTSEALLSLGPEESKKVVDKGHKALYDAIDTNKDGYISVKEFQAYLNAVGPCISQEDLRKSFNAIDANKNGEICREEWLTAAYDFFTGVKPTEISETFFGPLFP